MRIRSAAIIAAAALTLPLACSRGTAREDRRLRTTTHAAKGPLPPFDWDHPVSALELGPDEVAARIGSFEWTAAIEWTVSREGEEARRVHALERHQIRQASSGDFEVQAEIDPGLGKGSETGRDIVYTGGMTYAHARYAPFRERPTDRGRDARRYRDESFLTPRSVARLLGPALELRPIGDAETLQRPARKFTLSVAKAAPRAERSVAPASAAHDEDTRKRRAFLERLRPQSASGELLLDTATGAPLSVRISATFSLEGEPSSSATVELLAQVKALGAEVAAVSAPKGALPDERKAAGVAAALEAAGLKKAPEEKKGQAEPAEDGGQE